MNYNYEQYEAFHKEAHDKNPNKARYEHCLRQIEALREEARHFAPKDGAQHFLSILFGDNAFEEQLKRLSNQELCEAAFMNIYPLIHLDDVHSEAVWDEIMNRLGYAYRGPE